MSAAGIHTPTAPGVLETLTQKRLGDTRLDRRGTRRTSRGRPVSYRDLKLPPRRGTLFDPSAYGLLHALTEEHGDPRLHARRLVSQRCLYGVDKNAAAVELAKLSLWLVTLSRDLPFTFVDHALRHGDSLVGLDLDQIKSFHWEKKAQLETFRRALEDALDQALEHRARILELAEREDPAAQREKQRLLEYAEQATARIRLIADACVGAFFAHDKPKARETERKARLDLVNRLLEGDDTAYEPLAALARDIRAQHAPFHWMLEFPEVFWEQRQDPLDPAAEQRAAYMEAFVGNPPFMGKNGITEQGGPAYLTWLQAVHQGAHGNADLSAHFFLRAGDLLGAHGTMGLVATNTIAQGDTRATGLQALVTRDGFIIYDAARSMAWPGQAAVTVSLVHLAKGRAIRGVSTRRVDGTVAASITSRLTVGTERADALPLASNGNVAFIGYLMIGAGFELSVEERDALQAAAPANANFIFPLVNGADITSVPPDARSRQAIDFGTSTLDEVAHRAPALLARIRDLVKPVRDRNARANYRDNWWLYAEPRPGLRTALSSLQQSLVRPFVSKHHVFAFVSARSVIAAPMIAITSGAMTTFAIVQSRVHEAWARLLSSSLKTDLRYTASDCFETFPFPDPDPRAVIPELEQIGDQLYQARAKYMLDTDQGLTKTYNALKDPAEQDRRILTLRHLHEQMDRAVLAAYGWQDIQVPPFCPQTEEHRTALTTFEDEVIDRLYLLNATRAREEARLGRAKKTPAKRSPDAKKPIRSDQTDLGFD